MSDEKDYSASLSEALRLRKEWLENSELAKLKEELRVYQSAFTSLYNIFLKKKLISEDPYKQEVKIGELEVPETGSFVDAKRGEELSVRLSNFDNQLDFLVNFYQFSIDFLNLERIKRILGLVRYIDWSNLTPDATSPNTRAVAEITQLSKTGMDQIVLGVIGESLTNLPKATGAVIGILKHLTAYYKELYKLNVRTAITQNMSAADATSANIRKKIAASMPGQPFYQEFIDELIREDYSEQGSALRESVLKALKVADEKPKTVKAAVSFKSILIDGIRVIGSSPPTLSEIAVKIDENENLLQNQKKSLWEKILDAIRQMSNKEPEERVIEIALMDQAKGTQVRQKLNLTRFRIDLDKKIKTFSTMLAYGTTSTRYESMSEEQLVSLLEKAVRETQVLHRTLGALDEYFKAEAPKELRERIRGIKPELAALKNIFVRGNQLRHEYSAQKEEEEQMKRLGITPKA
ncbi:MAG TPA: hypothetical protein DEQ14_09170 [Treponema sp.]|nr:hypothetical protein [Treponema sp.]